ncbi:DUF1513 domain-containing protein [Methylibium petroleiphilum]|uniref:Twin-arginine translocation pathway signal n=1 Tax=Methylibium petroleiphilum (strain ATCC BAA-1232 / LMG 22953 / PM1) TaxID=420662 RepID=A2SFT4_METPP|nr:DUF1513 domain-containing protein [Methylibium petroleiphilum]ABM94423.1 conserved hypothetical protein [Methylibium petroleiphilum PM1]
MDRSARSADAPPPDRRRVLKLAAATALAGLGAHGPAFAATAPRLGWAAAWDGEAGAEIGVVAPQGAAALRVQARLAVPTRAHGLWAEAGGRSVLAVARRPGDWLVRWQPDGRRSPQWQWAEPGRAFNGHVIAGAGGTRLYTTETDLETGAAWIGVRDARSLEKLDEWPTHGIDAHELLLDDDDTGGHDAPSLWVANGGVPTRPETGRQKLNLDRMDSSLVRLDARSGALRGQWRLDDRRLSLRHMAWRDTPAAGARTQRVLGIALQAEHDDPAARQAAPVLALFDGERLRTFDGGAPAGASDAMGLAGYGGDIAATADGWAVSCPRVNGVALYAPDGRARGVAPLPNACALAVVDGVCWAAGQTEAMPLNAAPGRERRRLQHTAPLRLDNHWVGLAV